MVGSENSSGNESGSFGGGEVTAEDILEFLRKEWHQDFFLCFHVFLTTYPKTQRNFVYETWQATSLLIYFIYLPCLFVSDVKTVCTCFVLICVVCL